MGNGSGKGLYLMLVVLAFTFLFALPVSAHGGERIDHDGPVAGWMVGMIYIQLLAVPFLGIWLINEAFHAWLPQRNERDGRCQDDATGK